MNKPCPIISLFLLSVCLSVAGADASDEVTSDTVYWNDGRLEWSDFTPYYTEKDTSFRVNPGSDTIFIPEFVTMIPKVHAVDKESDSINFSDTIVNPELTSMLPQVNTIRKTDSVYLDYLEERRYRPAITIDVRRGVRFVKREEGNFKYYEGLSFTYMLKSGSRYDINRADSWSLRYSQVQFDIVEAVRRQFNSAFNSAPGNREILNYYNGLESSSVRAFRKESSYGSDTSVIRQYELRYKAILDSLEPNPVFKAGPVNCGHGYSISFGLFYEHFYNGLPGELITSPGLQMGLGYNYNNLSLQFILAGADVGHVPYEQFHYDSELDYKWRQGRKVTAARTSLNMGYRVLDRPYIALIPFVGAGVLELSQKTNLPESDKPGKYFYSTLYGQYYRLGLNLDWKLGRTLGAGISDSESLTSYNRVYSEQKIRFQLYGARTQLSGIGTGYSVGLSVSFNFDTWANKRL